MQFLILGILLDAPLTLYDVHKRFRAGISLFYAASFGSIQRALRQLESQGWARVDEAAANGRGRKLYRVTAEGRRSWHTWMTSPLTGSDPEPVMLARIHLLGHLPPAERPLCVEVIRTRISEDQSRLAALAEELDATDVPEAVRELYRFRRATLDYGLRSHGLALSWLDDLDLSA